tara:strand:- start:282 stop:542 length:261 start_codon:yes stop_codon:yes gene_type:complete
MCLGGKTTTSPTATNTNYFGRGPWGQDPNVRLPELTPTSAAPPAANPAVKTTKTTKSKTQDSTKASGLKIGGAGKVNQPTSGTINY